MWWMGGKGLVAGWWNVGCVGSGGPGDAGAVGGCPLRKMLWMYLNCRMRPAYGCAGKS